MIENIYKLVTLYDDAQRHALAAESADWDTTITPGLRQFGDLMEANFVRDPGSMMQVLRVIIEAVYVMGYERGKAAHDMPQFVVSTETEADK